MSAERAEFVAGLRELADWYAAHPEVPIGYKSTYRYVVLANDDATGSAEIQVFADALGVEVTRTLYAGHYHATRQFAGLTFEAYYVPREEAHRYTADQQLLKAAKAEMAANDSRAATAVPQPTGQGSPQVRDQSPGSGPGHNSAGAHNPADRETAAMPGVASPDTRTTAPASLPVEVERGRRGPGLDAATHRTSIELRNFSSASRRKAQRRAVCVCGWKSGWQEHAHLADLRARDHLSARDEEPSSQAHADAIRITSTPGEKLPYRVECDLHTDWSSTGDGGGIDEAVAQHIVDTAGPARRGHDFLTYGHPCIDVPAGVRVLGDPDYGQPSRSS